MDPSETSLNVSSREQDATTLPPSSSLPAQPSNSTGAAHEKPITDLALKTPISFLQEICFRIHANPTYSLCPSEAQCLSSEPAFLYRVVVDDMITFGKGKSNPTWSTAPASIDLCLGSSKKRAKHRAAWLMIEHCYAKLKSIDDPLVKTIEQYL